MGCQTSIVSEIVEKGGDYVIGLKGNQGNLHESVERYFADVSPEECEKSDDTSVLYHVEKGHGRIEERVYVIDEKVRWLPGFSKWAGLRSIGMVMSKRTIGDKQTSEGDTISPVCRAMLSLSRKQSEITGRLKMAYITCLMFHSERTAPGFAARMLQKIWLLSDE
jgi:hypothetical protein